jgi:hypothetical protein
MNVNCRSCGVRRADQDAVTALAWVYEPGDRWLCPRCARTQIREIESKLPDEWW